MTKVTITKAVDLGNDVLEVHGEVDGKPVVALGWMSAMTQHYDADDYGDLDELQAKKRKGVTAGRHLKKDATPREMTDAEKRSYMEGLFLAAAGPRDLPVPGGSN